jgi:hypothetical protein
MTPTRQAEQMILDIASRANRPISLKDDIKPVFENTDLPTTFAIWNLVKRGDLRRLGRGRYEGRLGIRISDRANELYWMVKRTLEEAEMSDELRFEAGRLISRIER